MAGAKTHFNRTGASLLADFKYAYGVPIGNVLYVNSAGSGSTTSGPGRTPENAYSTIQAALSGVTADNNDVILVCPSHVETITAASGVNITTSYNGVSIIGLARGRQRPTINYTTAVGASFDVSGNRVLISNLVFTLTGFDAITAAVNVSGADVTIEDCEAETGNATNQATLGLLTTAAADRFALRRCFFHGSANAGTAAAVRIVGGDAVVIEDNKFIGNYTTSLGAIDNATTALTNGMILRNYIYNRTASSTVAMTFQAGSTGIIAENRMQILSGTAPIVGAAMAWLGNTYAATIATAGSAT